MLVILFGDIGVGKSTLAKALAGRLGYELIQFDPIAPALTGKAMYGEDNEFMLDDADIGLVHGAMRERAREMLKGGKSAILESMYFKKQRDEAVALAETMGVPYRLVHVVCDENEVRRRVGKRYAADPQTAGIGLALGYRGQIGDEEREHITIDTTGKTAEESVAEALDKMHL